MRGRRAYIKDGKVVIKGKRRMADGFGFIEVPLKISTELADALRRPEGMTHFGTVTMKLTGDPEVLSIWFSEPDHSDGDECEQEGCAEPRYPGSRYCRQHTKEILNPPARIDGYGSDEPDAQTLADAEDALRLIDGWVGPHLCCVLTEDNGSFCGKELPCPDHCDGEAGG